MTPTSIQDCAALIYEAHSRLTAIDSPDEATSQLTEDLQLAWAWLHSLANSMSRQFLTHGADRTRDRIDPESVCIKALQEELGMPNCTIIDLFAELRKRLDVAYNNAHALDEACDKLSAIEAAGDEMAFNIERIMMTYVPPLQEASDKYRRVCRERLGPK